MSAHYKDKGCELHPSCLDCPIPPNKCPHTSPGGMKSFLKSQRDQEIRELAKAGKTEEELALQFQIGIRTIQRALKGKHA